MLKKISSIFISLMLLFLSACSNKEAPVNELSGDPSPSVHAEPSDKAAEPEKTPSPLVINDTGGVVISKVSTDYEYNTTIMILSKSGKVILCDPIDVYKDIEADVIVATHGHHDHWDSKAKLKKEGRQSLFTVETFTHDDITVTGIPSSHTGNEINEKNPDNVIYLIEVDGLRIAHLGDIGQDTLTEEQLKLLGRLDVVFMPCVDMPQFGLTISKARKVIEQMKPSVVVPTHYNPRDREDNDKIKNLFDANTSRSFKFSVDENLLDGKSKFIELK